MAAPAPGEITLVLDRVRQGDTRALQELAPLISAELRRLAGRLLKSQPPGHTWQPTDLVHELWLRLLSRHELQFENRAHFIGVAAHLMRVMVIDHARRRSANKRTPATLPQDMNAFEALLGLTDSRAAELMALEEALTRLAALRPRQAEIVELRYFAGSTVEETAEVLGISPKTVKREWAAARASLHSFMRGLEV
jgi:RNA polymerase sigma factor (TIGR02999 family)